MSRPTSKQKQLAYAYAKKAGLKVAAPGKVSGYGSYYPKKRSAPTRKVRGYGKYQDNYGSRLGATLGEGAERLLGQLGGLGGLTKLIGFGDYAPCNFNVKKNSLMDGINGGNDPPSIQNAKDGRVIIRHREYLQDIITGTSGAFRADTFPINPGQSLTFPWLSQVAAAFEQYRLRGMIFEFKSTSADALNSTNTALGSVIMATEYDVSKPAFSTKMQMENHQFSASARQSSSMLHPIECDRAQTPITELYVRTSAATDSNDNDTDLRLADWGNFTIATVGGQATGVNIGELWVTFEIELLKPCLLEVGPTQVADYYLSADGSYDTLNLFGTSTNRQHSAYNNLGTTLGATSITFPKGTVGTYIICMAWEGSSNGAIVYPTVSLSNATNGMNIVDNPFNNSLYGPSGTVSSSTEVLCYLVNIVGQTSTGAAPYFPMNGASATFPGTKTNMKLYIAAVYDKITYSSLQYNVDSPMYKAPVPALPSSNLHVTSDEDFNDFIKSQIGTLRTQYEAEKPTPTSEELTPQITPQAPTQEQLASKFAEMDAEAMIAFLDKVRAAKSKNLTSART